MGRDGVLHRRRALAVGAGRARCRHRGDHRRMRRVQPGDPYRLARRDPGARLGAPPAWPHLRLVGHPELLARHRPRPQCRNGCAPSPRGALAVDVTRRSRPEALRKAKHPSLSRRLWYVNSVHPIGLDPRAKPVTHYSSSNSCCQANAFCCQGPLPPPYRLGYATLCRESEG